MKLAYVTLACTPKYLEGALYLYNSYLQTKSKYPFYIMSWNETDKTGYQTLPIIVVDKIGAKGREPLFTKFNIFTLTDFDYTIFIDADCVFNKNADKFFENLIDNMKDNNVWVNSTTEVDLRYYSNIEYKVFSMSCFIVKTGLNSYNKILRELNSGFDEEIVLYNLYKNNQLKFFITKEEEYFLDPFRYGILYHTGNKFDPYKYWECEKGREFYKYLTTNPLPIVTNKRVGTEV